MYRLTYHYIPIDILYIEPKIEWPASALDGRSRGSDA